MIIGIITTERKWAKFRYIETRRNLIYEYANEFIQVNNTVSTFDSTYKICYGGHNNYHIRYYYKIGYTIFPIL